MLSSVGAFRPATAFVRPAAPTAPENPSPPRPEHASSGEAQTSQAGDPDALSPEQQREVTRLKTRDAEVRRHEQAHAAAGGQYAGSPQYDYEQGPDGKRYAVGGEVSIDVSPVKGDPKATLQKMAQVRRAALAPAEPSSQDRRVAAQASQAMAKARVELRQQQLERPAEPSPARAQHADRAYRTAAAPAPAEPTLKSVSCAKCGGVH